MVGCTVDQFMPALRSSYSPARAFVWSGCLRIGMARRTWVRSSLDSVRVTVCDLASHCPTVQGCRAASRVCLAAALNNRVLFRP